VKTTQWLSIFDEVSWERRHKYFHLIGVMERVTVLELQALKDSAASSSLSVSKGGGWFILSTLGQSLCEARGIAITYGQDCLIRCLLLLGQVLIGSCCYG
jgi:hypothetical protein